MVCIIGASQGNRLLYWSAAARELDSKKREALLHQIQEILHDRVTHVPIYELAFIWASVRGSRSPGST
jgi:ABC-type transport system substrate-binding protein